MTVRTFYLDVFPGMDEHQFGLSAQTKPYAKIANSRRISFEVDIPDVLFHEVDDVITEPAKNLRIVKME